MNQISLTIDGKEITATEGEKLLWVALENGIYIPNLCAIRDRPEPAAACRLCFVEVAGYDRPVTACTEAVTEGMTVNTRGERALRLARTGFELLMASHKVDCGHCPANRSCELQKIASHLRVKLKTTRFTTLLRDIPVDDSHPEFVYDANKCVLCGRCVWACRQQDKATFGFAHRGFERMVTTFGSKPMADAKCQDCTRCVSVCPCGALVLKEKEVAKT